MLALRRDQRSAHAIVIEFRIAAIQVGRAVQLAIGDQPRLLLDTGQLTTESIIQIDYPAFQVGPRKQLGLGGSVRFHGAVIIQVITGQIGQHRHIKRQRRRPPLIQPMRRHFHCHCARTGLFQVGQRRLNGYRVGRGMTAALQRAVEACAQRADDAAVLTQCIKRLGNQLSDAGLAVGAGNAYQIQAAARIAVEAAGNIGQLRGEPLDRDQRHVSDRQNGRAFYFVSHSRSATLERVGNMRTAIDLDTRNGQKQITRTDIAAVESQLANQGVAVGVSENLAQIKGHQPRPPLAAGAALTCSGGARLSGVTFIRRNVPDMTLLNTGAETRPP
ncbi:hypothetical protein ALQ26_05971 [Pseudomonas amygdali pv. lachrymans]|nr:hypothetical protein ALQ26_05971 [Pseudomonas amygdali pv. lachrymans]